MQHGITVTHSSGAHLMSSGQLSPRSIDTVTMNIHRYSLPLTFFPLPQPLCHYLILLPNIYVLPYTSKYTIIGTLLKVSLTCPCVFAILFDFRIGEQVMPEKTIEKKYSPSIVISINMGWCSARGFGQEKSIGFDCEVSTFVKG